MEYRILDGWTGVPRIWKYAARCTLESGPFDAEKSPFLREPLEAWEGDGRREITVIAPQQTGKTLAWLIPLMWQMEYHYGISLIIYPSDDKAEEINEQKVRPCLENNPRWAEELQKPKSRPKGLYRLGGNLAYFQGACRRISSISSPWCIADELDDWATEQEAPAGLGDLRLRQTSFDNCRLGKVCTVKGGSKSPIWKEFLSGSQGYYYLRCQGCGELTMRSCDTFNLSFTRTDDGEPVRGSCRLICPICKTEHEERQKKAMIQGGAYIHERPDRLYHHCSFQWGVLASLQPSHTWDYVAEKQCLAGRTGDYEDQRFFDNSVRGLPFTPRPKIKSGEANRFDTLRINPITEKPRFVVLSADTQVNHWVWIARAFFRGSKSQLIDYGKAMTVKELVSLFGRDFGGHGKPYKAIIDYGGGDDMPRIVKAIADRFPQVILYKGWGNVSLTDWRESKDDERLFLVPKKKAQADLLFKIYEGNGWYLTKDPAPEYLEQLGSMAPPAKKKPDEIIPYEKWDNFGRDDHYFDAEKMAFVAEKIITARFLPNEYKEKRKAKS